MSGWIKIDRNMLEWEWKTKPLTMALWVHILMKANYKDKRFQGHDVKRGELVVGREELALQTGLTAQQVRTALKHLKDTGEIVTRATNKFSIITVVKYESYQDDQPANNQQATNKQPTTNHKRKKERKKEGKKIEGAGPKKPHRIPDDWVCDAKLGEWAMNEGLTRGEVVSAIDQFKDHYAAATGKGSTALDWDAKFRTWVRNEIKWKK